MGIPPFDNKVKFALADRDIRAGASREALIKSLSDFILGFLCNARNSSTRIASYLKQQSCIGLLSQGKLAPFLHIKAPSFYPWPSYDEAVHKNSYEI
jgi:hypothetical protein